MKYATPGDVRAKFERDFNERWPGMSITSADPNQFVSWYLGWLDTNEVDEEDLGAVYWDCWEKL